MSNSNRRLLTAATLIAVSFWLAAVPSRAAEIAGVSFRDRVIVEESALGLHGMAVLRWALLFDVYAGALYLPPGLAGDRWREEVPKILELSYFREIAAEDFADSSDQLLRRVLPPQQYQALAERLQKLYGLFRDVHPGDRYTLVHIPSRGTELRFNRELLGTIPGHDFAVAYFGLWLGEQPISESFRDTLLTVRDKDQQEAG